ELLNGDACTECGRCQAACPAYMAGTPLNPKQVILNIRDSISAYQRLLPIGPHADSGADNGNTAAHGDLQVTGPRIRAAPLCRCWPIRSSATCCIGSAARARSIRTASARRAPWRIF